MKHLSSMHGLVITQNKAVIRLKTLAIIFIGNKYLSSWSISQKIFVGRFVMQNLFVSYKSRLFFRLNSGKL